MKLDAPTASRFARIALGHIGKEYPQKLDQVLVGDEDLLPPRELHPIFYGSFDWHSCVHGWWTLLTIRRLFPDIPESAEIAALADSSFTTDKVAAELAYLDRPLSAGFERPYGWGWLLYLHRETGRHEDRDWADRLEPLARVFAERFKAYLPKLTYPIRVGTHFNTAFAMLLARRWSIHRDRDLSKLISERARSWFLNDRDCQAWEPGGDEFLSPALTEALLLRHTSSSFPAWFDQFLPRLAEGEPASLLTPAIVSDRSDGKIAHLDGLNLSRAWAFSQIALGLGGHPALPIIRDAATRHLEASLPHVAGDYMGEHWLATFALLALLAMQGDGAG